MAKRKRSAAAADLGSTVRVPSQKNAAQQLGVTDRLLRDWQNEAWWHPAFRTSAGYDVAAIRAARDAMGRKGSEQSDAAKQIKLLTDREKLEQAKLETERKRRQERVDEGELLPRQALEIFAATLLTELGDWCDQLGGLVSAELPKKYRAKTAARIKAELDRRRRHVRAELERKAKETGGEGSKGQRGKGTKA